MVAPYPSVQVSRVCVSMSEYAKTNAQVPYKVRETRSIFLFFYNHDLNEALRLISPDGLVAPPGGPECYYWGDWTMGLWEAEGERERVGALVHTCVPRYLCRELTSGPSC